MCQVSIQRVPRENSGNMLVPDDVRDGVRKVNVQAQLAVRVRAVKSIGLMVV